MTNSNITPFAFEGKNIRVLTGNNGEPLFVGKDICEALGYADANNAMKLHCKGVVKRHLLQTAGGMQQMRVLSEGDMYRLMTHSKLEGAERFEALVFDDILPTIRNTGSYTAPVAKPASELAPLRTQRAISLAIDNGDKIKSRLPLLGDAAMQSIYAGLVNTAAGSAILPLARLEEKHKSATEVGAIFGVNRNTIGRLANQHNLKTAEYGHWELGNAEHNTSQRETFVYNAKAVAKFRELLSGANDNQKEISA